MKSRTAVFFSDEDKKKIEQTISDVESSTSGEIVAMVVERSDHYRDIDVIASVIISAVLSAWPAEIIYVNSDTLLRKFVFTFGWITEVPDVMRFITGLAGFVLLAIVLFVPVMFLIGRFTGLKRIFVSAGRREAQVREKALSVFRDKGLDLTKDGTGILFLVSMLERRVYVLADHGIYTMITQKKLDEYAATVSRGMAAGRAADALCEGIISAGKELALYFPRREDDVNEIPDRVIEG